MQRQDFDPREITSCVRHIFGASCTVENVAQFKGGTRKQVYFVDLASPVQRIVLYIWHDRNRYFADREDAGSAHSDVLAPSMFQRNIEVLTTLGVHVPEIYTMGTLDAGHEFALLEFVDGGNFTHFSERATSTARDAALTQIGTMLRTLNDTTRAFPGTAGDLSSPYPKRCDEVSRDTASLELAAAAATHAQVAEHQGRIEQRLHTLHSKLAPRGTFRLVHGELGPEHILLRKADQKVYFVDVEGLCFFDVEVEHALMKFRFGEAVYTRYFARNDLDPDRMEFYRFAQHVSLVYAGTRFLMGKFHDAAWAERLFSHNLARVLQMAEVT